MATECQAYYIVNARHGMFLDTHGSSVWVWNNGGRDVDTIIAQNTSQVSNRIRWTFIECPHQPGTSYIVNAYYTAFLDTHGSDVQVWNAGGRDAQEIIAGNTSQHAGNIRWQVIECPSQPSAYFIVNARHKMFLDTHGEEYEAVTVWNNGGRSVETVIEQNTSRHAGNIRWFLIPVERGNERVEDPGQVAEPLLQMPQAPMAVRIVHLSDTHNMHRQIEAKFPLPEGDILIHTGDFSDHGSPAELADFDDWLGEVGQRFRHVLLIPGNHDWWHTVRESVTSKALDPHAAICPSFMQEQFKNCRVLINEEVVIEGLRIFGSAWAPWQKDGNPDRMGNTDGHVQTGNAWTQHGGPLDAFSLIPEGVDVLMTHGPATDIMDCIGRTGRGQGWGSSRKLLKAIWRAKPRAHLFGHLHEQRGLWTKGTSELHPSTPGSKSRQAGYTGGIEYAVPGQGQSFPTIGPPAPDYPCEVVSCNAMCSHPGLDGTGINQIAGPARLILMVPRG